MVHPHKQVVEIMLNKRTYFEEDANLKSLDKKKVAVIGYGNQGRAQSLNLRDSGIDVIIGNIGDRNKTRAEKDGFKVMDIKDAAKKADIVFLLIPDEDIPDVFTQDIEPNLKKGTTICFASGYNIAYGLIKPLPHLDIIMIAPRMIGVGVRERYLTGEGFYSFIGVHQDYTGSAENILLALAGAVGTLKAGGIVTTMEQEALLDLFNEQAFGPAFGRVLLSSINILIKNGLPPEAVLCEMYMGGEMSYTYKKMAQIGLVKQTDFHSHTSQYGAMSRGIRYLKMGLEEKFQKSIDEIRSGDFAREWDSPFARLKFKLIKFFATRQKINKIERDVRKSLRLKEFDTKTAPEKIDELLSKPELQNEIDEIKELFEY
jgi:ketol-acid reductoisomerase